MLLLFLAVCLFIHINMNAITTQTKKTCHSQQHLLIQTDDHEDMQFMSLQAKASTSYLLLVRIHLTTAANCPNFL